MEGHNREEKLKQNNQTKKREMGQGEKYQNTPSSSFSSASSSPRERSSGTITNTTEIVIDNLGPTLKGHIREFVVGGRGGGGRSGEKMENPEEVLALSRAVEKIDSSME